MAIQKIQIWGYRSISYMELQAGQIVAFTGQNGSGKSNILSALHFFYCNLTRTWEEKGTTSGGMIWGETERGIIGPERWKFC